MNIRYRVELSETERRGLRAMLGGGKHAARKLKRAQILLAADAGVPDDAIAASFQMRPRMGAALRDDAVAPGAPEDQRLLLSLGFLVLYFLLFSVALLTHPRELSLRAFQALDCEGFARVDCFYEEATGRVLLNEVNTIPGFTPKSMFPLLWAASGLAYPDLVARLVDLAVERHAARRR